MSRGRIGGRLLVAALLATVGVLIAASGASAFIYWGDSQGKRIGRAANDGSVVEDAFIPATGVTPVAVAVDAAHIYWANQSSGTIGRANIDGSGVDNSFIDKLSEPSGVSVTASSIYWSAFGGVIGRANIDGSGKNQSFITGSNQTCGTAVDSGHVYWADIASGTPAYIARAGLNGSNKELSYVTIPGSSFPCGVAVNSANIFWTEIGIFGGGTRIGRANVNNGGGADPSFIGDAHTPCGIAAFGAQLFWANLETDSIGRANTDGTSVNQSFIATGGDQVCGIAVDSRAPAPKVDPPAGDGGGADVADTTPPQTRIVAGPGKRLADGVAKFRFRSSERGSTFRCKLDRRKPRRCASPQRYKGLKPGRHLFKVWATDAAGNKDRTPAKRRFRAPRR